MNGLPAILLGTALGVGVLVGYVGGYGRGWRRCEAMWQAEWDTREGSSIANHTPARFGTSTWNTAELPRRPAGATITDNLPADSYDGPPTKVLQQVLTGLQGMDLPPQHGTLPEHNRRLTAAMTLIAPSPVLGQVRVDTPATPTGGAMSGKYGVPAEAQPPPSTGGLAGPKPWLRWWPHDWALALAITGWWRLRDHLARTERHYWHDYETGRHRIENMGPELLGTVAQRRHSAAAGQRAIHAALTTPTGEYAMVQTAAQPEIDDEDLRRITDTWRAQTVAMGAVW